MRVRDVLGVSQRRQRQLTRALQLSLVGFIFVGFDRGNLGIVVNAAIALGVTYLPAVLERDYQVPMDAALTLWVSLAVFLHALGTLGPYQNIWWWDHLTHALSSSVVAAGGYAVARGIDEHTEDIHLPTGFMVPFLFMVTLAFGVFWEVIEFGVSGAASLLGSDTVLTQYGIGDTMLDLVFDTAGAALVAAGGWAYLTDVTTAISDRLDRGGG
ncbi:hypothetical protein [Halocalculus aciditolerans]|uniref:Uncharacterized protein n=1 Tax=Halocalculus aciditolerans TaxID=1383812 RepID=A0A830F3Z9_9EURY|nr:hypothetical protein [Halocalculus aciditolerans]GGL52941.1 hypothetical protein GCM10009039_08920 [Halocalculus aciditolerans]